MLLTDRYNRKKKEKWKVTNMENTINQIISTFRTYNSRNLLDKNATNLSDKIYSDMLSDNVEESKSDSAIAETSNEIRGNRLKYSTTDDNKVVVQVIRDDSGRVIRTIPLNEQKALDIFE